MFGTRTNAQSQVETSTGRIRLGWVCIQFGSPGLASCGQQNHEGVGGGLVFPNGYWVGGRMGNCVGESINGYMNKWMRG